MLVLAIPFFFLLECIGNIKKINNVRSYPTYLEVDFFSKIEKVDGRCIRLCGGVRLRGDFQMLILGKALICAS